MLHFDDRYCVGVSVVSSPGHAHFSGRLLQQTACRWATNRQTPQDKWSRRKPEVPARAVLFQSTALDGLDLSHPTLR